jgi:hypothetical protein
MATETQQTLTPLQELNNEFRHQYIRARDNFWLSQTEKNSIIIGNGSSLTLIHKGTHYPVPKAIPQVYHDLKSISHIPLTIYLHLNNDSSISTDETLKQYMQHLDNLQVPDSIESNERPSVERIITNSKRLLQKEINNKGSVDQNELTQFCRELAADLKVLLDAAAIAQLKAMHEIVQNWIKEHKIDVKDPSFKVLLISARTARQNNLQTTYFEHLLGVEQKRNIAYIEELFGDQPKATSIFSTWFLDEQLSVASFNDQDRMHRDLLMNDDVEEYIKNHLFS